MGAAGGKGTGEAAAPLIYPLWRRPCINVLEHTPKARVLITGWKVALTCYISHQCKKTPQFKAQCKGDISHPSKTAKFTAFDPVICKLQMCPYETSCYAKHQ